MVDIYISEEEEEIIETEDELELSSSSSTYTTSLENNDKAVHANRNYSKSINNNLGQKDLAKNNIALNIESINDKIKSKILNVKKTTTGEPIEGLIPTITNTKREMSKVNTKSKLSWFMQIFLNEYESRLKGKTDFGEQKMRVSNVFGSLALVYERIRTAVEYKGEHVLRRNAIERMLKRLVWEKESIRPNINVKNIAESLVKELIWARYIPNNLIPNSKVTQLERVINKYLIVLGNTQNLPKGLKISGFRNWVWGVASAEIEDLLDPSNRDLYIKLMYNWFNSYFEWQDDNVDENEKKLQIYLAIHRAYTKSDDPIMRYHLLLREFPNWPEGREDDIHTFIRNFQEVYNNIEKELNFPGWLNLYRRVQKHVAAFEIFHDIATKKKLSLRKLLLDDEYLEENVKKVCTAKYKQVSKKVSTGIVRSIIYIFITKVVLALIIEVPYEVIRLGDVRYTPLMINILVPPLLMWFIGFSIRPPGSKNTIAILQRLKTVVYRGKSTTKQKFVTSKVDTGSKLMSIFGILYASIFLIVFGGMAYLLWEIQFTMIGIIIFFFFLSLVMLFAFRIRYNANQLKIESADEGFLSHIFSYLTLPFLNLGFYLSQGLSKINFFTIIFDFLIEAPLKTVLEIVEEWTSFIKQKREEVVDVPE